MSKERKKKMKKNVFSFLLIFMLLFSVMAITVFAEGNEQSVVGNVAVVNGVEYATVDAAIAAWTNGTTLKLLNNVTLSDVITIKSTEHHILDLGTYTMTAAEGKNAIEIIASGTGSSERSAITVTADANNPGGINAGNKSVIYYDYSKGGISGDDRPIIKINGGVFAGSTSSFGSAGIYAKGTAARKCATLNISGGTFNCSILGTGKSKMLISGGMFNYSVGSQGDSTCYRLISGGAFKSFGFMTADAANKFTVGSSMGVFDLGAYINDDGYLVVGGPVITENDGRFEASSNYSGFSSYLRYSSAATNGLYYTSLEEAMADNNKSSGKIEVQSDIIDLTDSTYTGTLLIKEGQVLTVVFALDAAPISIDEYSVPWKVGTDVPGKAVSYSESISGNVVTRVYKVVTPIAKIGDNYFETINDAIDFAKEGQTITLLGDISLSGIVTVDKSLTIDGQGQYSITGSAKKVFEIKNSGTEKMSVIFKDVDIINTAIYGRCIDTRTDNIDLLIENCDLVATNTSTQPLTIGGSETEGLTVTFNGGSIDSGKSGYAIISFVPVELNISSSAIKGYSCIYMKDGSEGSVINLNGGTEIVSVNENIYAPNDANSFSAVVFEDSDIIFNVNNGAKMRAIAGESAQSIFAYRATPVTLNVAADAEFIINGDKAICFGDLRAGLIFNMENVDFVEIVEDSLDDFGLTLYGNVSGYKPVLKGEFANVDTIISCCECTVEFADYVITNADVIVNGTKVDVTSGSYTFTSGEYTVVLKHKTLGDEIGTFTVSLQADHSLVREWNNYAHWFKCTLCGEVVDVANHGWIEAGVIKAATETETGLFRYVCTCGGYKDVVIPVLGHTHVAGTEWKHDDTAHWNECACGELMNVAAHTWNDGVIEGEVVTYTCTVCGAQTEEEAPHVHVAGTEYKYDETNHWNECACGEKLNEGAHLWVTDKVENSTIYSKCVLCEATAETPEQTGAYDDEPVSYLLPALAISVITVAFAAVVAKRKFN